MLPSFFNRVADAVLPVLGGAPREELRRKLEGLAVTLRAPAAPMDIANRAGFLLAANLAARFYPRIGVVAPDDLRGDATRLIRSINPGAEVSQSLTTSNGTLAWGNRDSNGPEVFVAAHGWNVLVDTDGPTSPLPAVPAAALAAAALGMGELFRTVFSDCLGGRARKGPQPGIWNLVTQTARWEEVPPPAGAADLGRFFLAGAGAIGQAVVETFRHVPASGTLVVVDPENVELSNLQRYVLARDSDVKKRKTHLVRRMLKDTQIAVEEVHAAWGAVDAAGPHGSVVLVAVDSAEVRIGIQASLPGRVYNAWTQPADLGWSRHEAFGQQPCLACLYWPTGLRPNRHQVIARALGQPDARVLGYLLDAIPVGAPLAPAVVQRLVQRQPLPDADRWVRVPILEDIVASFGLSAQEAGNWKDRQIERLYREGICGGAILKTGATAVAETVVPMAHQSALAGIMLATQFLVSNMPELLAFRPMNTEGRFDVLRGLPQDVQFPRQRTPACLCFDSDFQEAHRRAHAKVA